MRHYCTLTDRNYLPKMLAMYESLRRHSSEEFWLHVLCLDDETHSFVATGLDRSASKPRDLCVIPTGPEFSEVHRGAESWQEHCWMMGSQFTEELMRPGVYDITYLDADLFFFSDPKPVFDEIGNRSIGIIEHRFIPEKRHLAVNGRFNVGMVHFKNTPVGRECLSRWAAQVRERCDASTCGDQKFLDEWPQRYGDEVAIIQNIGANLAPWNLANYSVTDGPRVDGQDVLWYHFHEYIHHERLTNYRLRQEDVDLIYRPYVDAINHADKLIESLGVAR